MIPSAPLYARHAICAQLDAKHPLRTPDCLPCDRVSSSHSCLPSSSLPFIGEQRSGILQLAQLFKMKPNPSAIYWVLLALCATVHAADKAKTYRAPRLADGHVDMQGIWKNSNLAPLERPPDFTTLAITAADAAKLKAQYLQGTGGPNQPDDPGRVLEDRNIEPIRGELRSSQIVDPEDGKIPWNEVYREKAAALRRAVLTAYDNP
jgi:hypothetical protein